MPVSAAAHPPEMVMNSEKGGRIALVEFGRGIAALLVLFVHASSMMRSSQYAGHVFRADIFSKGFVGVDFFFVLSGFIICYVHFNDIGQPLRLKRYGWRRLARVLPTYWCVFTFALLLNQLLQKDKAPLGFAWFFQQWFLLGHGDDFLIGPAWTLQFELLFYTLFASTLLSKPLGFGIIISWFVSIFAYRLLVGDIGDALNQPSIFKIIIHPYNANFLFGMALGIAQRRRQGVMALTLLYAFLALGFLIYWSHYGLNWHNFPRYLGIGLICATILGSLLLIGRLALQVPRWLTFLGTISYSLYLSHIFFVGYFYAVAARLGLFNSLPAVALFIGALISGICGAWLLYRLVEKPVQAWAHRVVR